MYAYSFLFSYKSLAGGGPSSIKLGSFQAQRLARNVISPVVVRTFSVGPPPVNLPSAGAVPGPHSPPSVVTRISEKSERIRWPLANSMDARMVMFNVGTR